jgi:hypothetical protein
VPTEIHRGAICCAAQFRFCCWPGPPYGLHLRIVGDTSCPDENSRAAYPDLYSLRHWRRFLASSPAKAPTCRCRWPGWAPRRGTQSLALTVNDPDAPDPAAPRMTWLHWVLYNIPASAAARGVVGLVRRSGVIATSISSMRWMWCSPIQCAEQGCVGAGHAGARAEGAQRRGSFPN